MVSHTFFDDDLKENTKCEQEIGFSDEIMFYYTLSRYHTLSIADIGYGNNLDSFHCMLSHKFHVTSEHPLESGIAGKDLAAELQGLLRNLATI
ncbi:hypothetical protein V3C99_007174 [Haemonchus contortus]